MDRPAHGNRKIRSRQRRPAPPRRRPGRPSTALALATALLLATPGSVRGAPRPDPGEHPPLAGLPLEEALLELRSRGLEVLFTSRVVTAEMRVEEEPTGSDPRSLLRQLLAPHGLALLEGAGGALVVVPRDPEPAEEGSEPSIVVVEEVVVVPSRFSLLRETPTAELALSRSRIEALPHLGDDVLRAISRLPGVIAGDVTARIQVRGGRRDETKVLLDGQELFQAFHLQDYDEAVSLIGPSTLAGAELSTGGYPARRGDRMGGVLELVTRRPRGATRGWAGASILGGQLGGGGTLTAGRGHWLAEARRGSIGVVSQLLDSEDPEYWDAFAKGELSLGERDTLSVHALAAGDALDFREAVEDEEKRFDTDYDNLHAWLTHQRVVSARTLLETAVSAVRLERDRFGFESEESGEFEVDDRRRTDVEEVRQAVDHHRGRHEISWGWRAREIETRFDYASSSAFDTPLALLRGPVGPGPGPPPSPDDDDGEPQVTTFRGGLESTDVGLWASDRVRLGGAVSLEAGLRWDRHSSTGEEVWSPRLGLAWRASEATTVRASWGLFHQSQRPFELQAEDGESRLQPVERGEHRIVGVERSLPRVAGGMVLRVEAYQRQISDPRARWENLYEPVNTFPEIEPERVLVAPGKSRARGVELFVQGRAGERALWWASYALASTEDRIDGRWRRRLYDQSHALDLVLDLRLGAAWRLDLAWRWHTGWPTTPLALEEVAHGEGETELVPVIGRLNGDRLPTYHRLDLRLGRRWSLGGVELLAFVDVQNVYDRRNVGGFDYEIDEDEGVLLAEPEEWPGLVPSAGVRVDF